MFLTKEHRIVSMPENIKHNERQKPRQIETQPRGKFYPPPRVRFTQKLIPSPAVAAYAKEEIYQAPQGQKIVADKKIFQIQNTAARAKGLKPLPEIKTQDAGER